MAVDRKEVLVESREQWRDWLRAHHADSSGIWLVTWKKRAGGDRHVGYDAIVEEALCFGWVDSVPRTVDAEHTALLLTPRKPGSRWSRPNKERVQRLTAAGLMAPAGLQMVELAKKTGTWTALDEVEDLTEPPDLAAALDADPEARRHWEEFPRSARRGILEWIVSAKRPQTRDKRIRETAELAARGERANQWPRRG